MSKTLNMVGGGAKGLFASILATGVSETDTVTLTTPSGKVKSGKWSSRPNPAAHGLPAEYQEVEYLETTGTQHIRTDYYAKTNTVVKARFKINSATYKSTWCQFLGCEGSSSPKTNDWSIWITSDLNLIFSNTTNGDFSYPFNYGDEYDLKFGNGNAFINDINVKKWEQITFSCSQPVSIGAVTTREIDYPKPSMTIYPFSFEEDGMAVRNYIPCYRKSDNKPGMYDIVTGAFLTNAGTGEFSVGADVPDSFDGFLFEKLGEFGNYTITASNGEKTVNETVLVDVVAEYVIEIDYSGGA